ncbi:MAG: YggS family pyridoxal phosphate-dependent enzyme [Pauljensenia sp.]
MTLAQRIDHTCGRILAAMDACGRSDRCDLELAVKTRTAETYREAARLLADRGLPVLLGHNRVQEARATAEAIREVPGARIHLIGPLQSNKVNQAVSAVDLIETVDSVELVERMDHRLRSRFPVFVQVNTSGEPSKHGCTPQDAPRVVAAIEMASHLYLHGFMTVGLNSDREHAVRTSYARLRQVRDEAAVHLCTTDTDLALSMGMSADLEWAVSEGATIVRVGSAVFGPRLQR